MLVCLLDSLQSSSVIIKPTFQWFQWHHYGLKPPGVSFLFCTLLVLEAGRTPADAELVSRLCFTSVLVFNPAAALVYTSLTWLHWESSLTFNWLGLHCSAGEQNTARGVASLCAQNLPGSFCGQRPGPAYSCHSPELEDSTDQKPVRNRLVDGIRYFVTSQYISLKANNEANNYIVVRITC